MSDNQQAAVAAVATAHDAATMMGFQNLGAFEFMQRVAKSFALSTMVPDAYRAVIEEGYGAKKTYTQNDAAMSNCMVALDLAHRMNASPLQVMQNLHVIEGRPSWSSAFIIALINNSGLYAHNLRFRFEELGEKEAEFTTWEWGDVRGEKVSVVKKVPIMNARCVAWTKDKATGEIIESPAVTIEMAVAEGWYTRNGSKWRTMPQLMCQYRAAAIFGRTYNPELMMGLPAAEELHDIIDVVPQSDGSYAVPSGGPEAAAVEARPTPRAPRAKSAPAPVDATAPAPTPTPEPIPAPAPAPVAAAPDVVAHPPQETARAIKPGVDMDTGEVMPVVNAEVDTLTGNLFANTPAAEEVQPAATEPKPAAKTARARPDLVKPASAAAATPTPVGPPLTPAKIKFVADQLDKEKWTTDDFKEEFGIEPGELREANFPAVLAWLKKPKGGA